MVAVLPGIVLDPAECDLSFLTSHHLNAWRVGDDRDFDCHVAVVGTELGEAVDLLLDLSWRGQVSDLHPGGSLELADNRTQSVLGRYQELILVTSELLFYLAVVRLRAFLFHHSDLCCVFSIFCHVLTCVSKCELSLHKPLVREPPKKRLATTSGQRWFVRVGVDSALHRLRDSEFHSAVFEDVHSIYTLSE